MHAAWCLSGLRKFGCGNSVRQSGIGIAVVLGLIVATPGVAWASPGCTALNGRSGLNKVETGSRNGVGFDAGDTITVTLTTIGAATSIGLYNNSTHNPIITSFSTAGSQTYVVPTATGDDFLISGFNNDNAALMSWSCVSAGGSSGSTDSDKLKSVQTTGSTVVANTSGSNTSGSVNSAVDEALSSSGSGGSTSPVAYMTEEEFIANWLLQRQAGTASPSYNALRRQALAEYKERTAEGKAFIAQPGRWPGYITVPAPTSRFAPEARSDITRRTDEAFAALGYAAVNKAPRQALVFAPRWSTWADVRGSGFEQSDSRALKGTQINATGGITYRLRPDLVVGAFAGYENFNYDFASLAGNLKGNGGTIGTYAGWQITPTLRWKGMIGWTGLGYDASAATASGGFDGSRWLVSTGLTGSHRVASFIVEPSVDVFALWERQTGYTDTLGTLHDARNFSTGRVSLGGRALAPMPEWSGVTPYLGFYGDWRFASDTAQLAAVPFTGIGDGWSARVTGGFNMRVFTAGSLSLGGEYGGIGANYGVWTGKARLAVPF